MGKYNEKIANHSIWHTVTPTPAAAALPFTIMEIGHFYAENEYLVKRDYHESFLMLYTINGSGVVQTGDTSLILSTNQVVLIDCHIPQQYHSNDTSWEFLWMHINGASLKAIFDMIYPNGARPIQIKNTYDIPSDFEELLEYCLGNDIANSMKISSRLHALFHLLYTSTLERENTPIKKEQQTAINHVIHYIEQHYADAITIDDMMKEIHISKYHFIRLFNRVIGATPYHYLTTHRINAAKKLLYTTDKTVSEIAEACGFSDTSNFITQFKKHTGQKPLQYRNSFQVNS